MEEQTKETEMAIKRQTRVTLILQAQNRVTLAHDQLTKLDHFDPRFIDAFNEYREALDARSAAEKSTR